MKKFEFSHILQMKHLICHTATSQQQHYRMKLRCAQPPSPPGTYHKSIYSDLKLGKGLLYEFKQIAPELSQNATWKWGHRGAKSCTSIMFLKVPIPGTEFAIRPSSRLCC